MAAHKRSNPTELLKEKQQILKDMESRLPVDSEDPEAAQARRKKAAGPPRKKGALVTGFIPPNNIA